MGATVVVLIVRGVPTENPAEEPDEASSQPIISKLTQIVLIVPPTADTLRTVKSPHSCSNSNGIAL